MSGRCLKIEASSSKYKLEVLQIGTSSCRMSCSAHEHVHATRRRHQHQRAARTRTSSPKNAAIYSGTLFWPNIGVHHNESPCLCPPQAWTTVPSCSVQRSCAGRPHPPTTCNAKILARYNTISVVLAATLELTHCLSPNRGRTRCMVWTSSSAPAATQPCRTPTTIK